MGITASRSTLLAGKALAASDSKQERSLLKARVYAGGLSGCRGRRMSDSLSSQRVAVAALRVPLATTQFERRQAGGGCGAEADCSA